MKYLSLLLLCFCLSACLNEGTDTGNPGLTEGQPADNIDTKPGLIQQFTDKICLLLEDCDTINQCSSRVLQQTNIDVKLGLGADDYANLIEISGALALGILEEDPDVRDTCFDDIDALTCASPNVDDAYDNMKANPLEGVANIVPNSCMGLVR